MATKVASVLSEVTRVARRTGDVRQRYGLTGAIRRGTGKVLAYASYPFQRRRLGRKTFHYRGEDLPFFVHHYSATWRNERIVEIPIVDAFLAGRGDNGLEIGNVLAHYRPDVTHTVVDKYEKTRGVLNQDVVDYRPDRPVDWIVVISTIEHVGWDESPRRPAKLAEAVEHLRSLLAEHGRMLVTAPRGYNAYLDDAIASGALRPTVEAFLHRELGTHWQEEPRETALARRPRYDAGAYDLWVAEFSPLVQKN